jgi:endonuclease-8
MWEDLVDLMALGVRDGVIRTVREQHLSDAERSDGQRVSYVYRRTDEPCRVCGSRVQARELQGRTVYWCGRCQPRFRSRAVQ